MEYVSAAFALVTMLLVYPPTLIIFGAVFGLLYFLKRRGVKVPAPIKWLIFLFAIVAAVIVAATSFVR